MDVDVVAGAKFLVGGVGGEAALVGEPGAEDGGAVHEEGGVGGAGAAEVGGVSIEVGLELGVGGLGRGGGVFEEELHFIAELAADEGVVLVEAEGAGFAVVDFLLDIGVDEFGVFLGGGGAAGGALETEVEVLEHRGGDDDLILAGGGDGGAAPDSEDAKEGCAEEQEVKEGLAEERHGGKERRGAKGESGFRQN